MMILGDSFEEFRINWFIVRRRKDFHQPLTNQIEFRGSPSNVCHMPGPLLSNAWKTLPFPIMPTCIGENFAESVIAVEGAPRGRHPPNDGDGVLPPLVTCLALSAFPGRHLLLCFFHSLLNGKDSVVFILTTS